MIEAVPHIVTSYALAVAEGHILAGHLVKRACRRHLRDLEKAKKRKAEFWFDEVEATNAIKFFEQLKQSKGVWKGRPFKLGAWQAFIIGSVYGWRRRSDNTRRFRTAYVEVSRKNGKSTLGAGVGLKALSADREGMAEVYAVATKRDQAKIVWAEARRMARSSPALRSRMNIQKHRLEYPKTEAFFIPLSADSGTADGLNPHTVVADELHAYKDRELFDLLTTAMGARSQPLMFIITTAGDAGDTKSVYREMHDYAIAVLEGFDKRGGIHDDAVFAYIATIDEKDDWTDPAVWGKANPNLNVSVPLQYLKDELKRALVIPARAIAFKRLYLNILTSSESAWLDIKDWDACAAPFDEAILTGRLAHMGVDLSSRRDTTAYALLFPPIEDDPLWSLLVRTFVPEATIVDREREEKLPYRQWEAEGYVEFTPGNTVDQPLIRKRINEDAERFHIASVGFDEWNAVQLMSDLEHRDGFDVYALRYGMHSMNQPTKEFEDLIVDAQIRVGANPLLRNQAQNTVIRFDENMNYMPAKKKTRGRIDGVSASIIATARATADNEDGSFWDRPRTEERAPN